ncbi:hypothetical protein SOVF_191530 [Spinacia oleracea]|nr:hypothetical protein SOVF_191530 [Spinacia oleracea]
MATSSNLRLLPSGPRFDEQGFEAAIHGGLLCLFEALN